MRLIEIWIKRMMRVLRILTVKLGMKINNNKSRNVRIIEHLSSCSCIIQNEHWKSKVISTKGCGILKIAYNQEQEK